MTLSAALWAANADLAEAALAHPFVAGIGDGTLPRERFAGYVAQDAFFLDAFARGYALGLAHSPDRAAADVFADLLAGVRDELRLHGSYATRWGLDLTGVEPRPATLAYTEFLLATASLGSTAVTCAAMVPCLRLYAFLGRSLARTVEPAGDYAEWVASYADPSLEELTGRLEALLDRLATGAGDTAPLHRAYRRAMQLELGFFDAAWSGT